MRWSILDRNSEVLAVHAALLHTGQILYFGGDENDLTQAKLFEKSRDLAAINHTRLFDCTTFSIVDPGSPTTDVFCSGHALLEDGRLLIAGGTFELSDDTADPRGIHQHHSPGIRDSWVFTPDPARRVGKWLKGADMNTEPTRPMESSSGGRWYPTLITLPQGEVIAMCGHPGIGDSRHNNNTPEIFHGQSSQPGTWRLLGPVGDSEFPWAPEDGAVESLYYPRIFLLPTAHIFSVTPLHRLANQSTGDMDSILYSPWDGVVMPCGKGLSPPHDGSAASSVLLPLRPKSGYSAKILVCGGTQPQVIDLHNPTNSKVTWNPTTQRQIQQPRWYCNAVLLPTGEVFVCGGITPDFNADPSGWFLDRNHVLNPEIYDPERDTWVPSAKWQGVPAAQVPRQYHSVALLMPDGRIWTAGSSKDHGHSFPNYPDRVANSHAEFRIEIFEPWYFGQSRPQITSSPETLGSGSDFDLGCPQAGSIARVALVRCGSATHAFNSDQRYVELQFHRATGNNLVIQMPPNSNITPPGYYLLFVLDNNNVPSVGRFVNIRVACYAQATHRYI
jgi:hypothetical protein